MLFVPTPLRAYSILSSAIRTSRTSSPLRMAAQNATKMSSLPQHHEVRYDLYRGHPNMDMLPHAEMQKIMSDFLQGEEGEGVGSWGKYLNYGANAGSERFRSVLRSFLDRRTEDDDFGACSSAKQDVIDRELFITNGVSHGLELLCGTLTQPGDEVWVERPTYFLASGIFKSNGLVVRPLPMMSDRCDNGENRGECIGRIDTERLARIVEEEGVAPPTMIYVIPSYHNPTGRSMTVQERRELAAFAQRHGVYLVADEVYHILDWEQSGSEGDATDTETGSEGDATDTENVTRRPAGIVHFNDATSESGGKNDGCCISVSSFTKIWAPGIRLGWIDGPSHIIERLKHYGYIDSQGGVAPLMGRILTHAIESNLLDQYLDKLKTEYAERQTLVCSMLAEEPRIAVLSRDSPVKRQGGYFIWVGLPPQVDSDDFLAYSLEHYSLKFMAGGRCDPFPMTDRDASGRSIRSCARLCFADLNRDDLANATAAFLEAFRSYMKSIE